MSAKFRESYQMEQGLEQAVIDLVRIGATGFTPGVRQLAARLLRAVPEDVHDIAAFRESINEAVSAAASQKSVGLRYAAGEVPTSDDGGLELADVDPMPGVDRFVLPPRTRSLMQGLVDERRRADEFALAGVPLTRTVLFAGPPGVGKTLGANWVAGELGLPLVTLSLAAVTSSYLGSSGRNLRAVLDYAKSGPCVLFLDEFDAIAKRRDDDSDIGELKRLVNVILVELDRWSDRSLLLAATNHPQLLDPAIERRFDVLVDFDLPGPAERGALLRDLLGEAGVDGSGVEPLLVAATDGYSHAGIQREVLAARRHALLDRGNALDQLAASLLLREQPAGPARDELWRIAVEDMGMSRRRLAHDLGLTHPTISAGVQRARERRDRNTEST